MTADFRMLQMSIPLAEVQSGPREGRSMNPEEAQETEGRVLGFGRLFQQAAEELDDEPAGDAATDPEGGKDLPERQSTQASDEGLAVATAGPSIHVQASPAPEVRSPAQEGGPYPEAEPSAVPAFDFDLPPADRSPAAGAEISLQASDQPRLASTPHLSLPSPGATHPSGMPEQGPRSAAPVSRPESGGTEAASSLSGHYPLEKGVGTVAEKALTPDVRLAANAPDVPVAAGSGMGRGGSDELMSIDRGMTEPFPRSGAGDLMGRKGGSILAMSAQAMEGLQSGDPVTDSPGAEQPSFGRPAVLMERDGSGSPVVQVGSTSLSAMNPDPRRLTGQDIPANLPAAAGQATAEGRLPLQEGKGVPPVAALAEDITLPASALQEGKGVPSVAVPVDASGQGIRSEGDRRRTAGNIQWASLTTAQIGSDSPAGNPGPSADKASPGFSLDALQEDPGLDMAQYRSVGDARFPSAPAAPSHTSPSQGQVLSPLPEGRIDEFLGHKNWEQSMARQMLEFAVNGTQHAVLRLQPDNLGALDVRLHTEEGEARIQFTTPHALVKDAVEGALPRLREMFHSGGLDLVEVNVSGQESFARQQAAGGDGGDNQPHRGHSSSSMEGQEDFSSERLSGPGDALIDYYI